MFRDQHNLGVPSAHTRAVIYYNSYCKLSINVHAVVVIATKQEIRADLYAILMTSRGTRRF